MPDLRLAYAEVRCVAIPTFTSHSSESVKAGKIVAEILSAEMLSRTAYNLIDPEEIEGILKQQNIQLGRSLELSKALWIGKILGADAVLIGAVLEYGYQHQGNKLLGNPFVTIEMKLLDVASKDIIWSATSSRVGGDAFHGQRKPLTLLTMQLLNDLIKTMPASAPQSGDKRDCGSTTVSLDIDNDGILNFADGCPTLSETFNGVEDFDGCPEIKTADQPYLAYLSLSGDRLLLKLPIIFDNKQELKGGEGLSALEQLAKFLLANPQIKKVMIESFAEPEESKSSVKKSEFRERFAFKRAAAVKTFLLRHGVEEQRLIAVGYGALDQPHEQEIEFTIVE